MALAESFLDLLTRNARGYRDSGMPVAGMRRDLRKAIDAYYAAELAGDREAMAAAEADICIITLGAQMCGDPTPTDTCVCALYG